MTTLTEAVRRFLKYQDEWDTMAGRGAYRALQAARKDLDALLAEPVAMKVVWKDDPSGWTRSPHLEPAAPQAEPSDEQIEQICRIGYHQSTIAYRKEVHRILSVRPAPVAEPAASCSECGKTSTANSMWALYCVECIRTKVGPALAAAAPPQPVAPIDMVLYCPACGTQHIDAPEWPAGTAKENEYVNAKPWSNPPHRSHLCHGCGHIWRPADVPTNGVQAIKTSGKNDSPIPQPVAHGDYPPLPPYDDTVGRVSPEGKDYEVIVWGEEKMHAELVADRAARSKREEGGS